MKKALVHIRTSLKLIFLIAIGALLIISAVVLIYKPTYSVTLNGEFVGYTQSKTKLQNKINTYMEEGDSSTNIAFVQIDDMPQYKLCLLQKGIETSDDDIFQKVVETGTVYYKYYTITESSEEKLHLSTYSEAEQAVAKLKEKNSVNKEKVGIVEKYSTELAEFVTADAAVEKLYQAPVVKKKYTSTGISTTANTTGPKVSLSVALVRPVSGTITSRFGRRSGGTHTGLDIATSRGTSIVAAAGGTVTSASYRGSYGNLIIISHGNGIETYYAHCDSINVSAGQTVSQGQLIGRVGSTGNSTGPHLHLEVRVNGVAQNPQNYVY